MPSKLDKLEKKLINAGVPADKAKLLLDTASDETIAGVLETLANRDDDYTAQLGRVKALQDEKSRLEQVKKDYDDWYVNTAVPAMQRIAGQNPQPTQQAQQAQPAAAGLTLADVQKMLQERDASYANVIKQTTRLASRHAANYHEELDVDALEKIATDSKLSLTDAYNQFIKPREDARNKEAIEARIKAAREEAVKEYTAAHGLPATPVPTEVNYINRHNIPPELKTKDESALNAELLATWNTAGAAAAAR